MSLQSHCVISAQKFCTVRGTTDNWPFRLPISFNSQAELLNHSQTPCTNPKDFVPDTKDKIYLFYMRMDHTRDYTTWINVARCFRIWDLDARGFHKGLWRMWVKGNHLLYIGCPISPYCSHKPDHLQPIYMPNTETRPSDENFFARWK